MDGPTSLNPRIRREFLSQGLRGVTGLALATLMADEGLLAPISAAPEGALAPRATHFAPTARHCIFLFMWGGPSQVDLFDPKPQLRRLDGQPLPDSILNGAEFAFAQKDTARLMGSPFRFGRHGRSGLEFSELLPNLARHGDDMVLLRTLHTDTFNHHPGQLLMNTGFPRGGRPTLGSWLNYGLGNPSRNLPGFVAMTSGERPDGGSTYWSSGFLPSNFQGAPLRNEGEPILDLANPAGVVAEAHHRSLDALTHLNRQRFEQTHDPEILSRIADYELAFRMQSAAPELCDLTGESPATLDAYGLNRGSPVERNFARNCLLARRLVERGVRFVNLLHGDWDAHFNLSGNHAEHCKTVDQPIAAMLEDLKQRGLLETTLVIWAGEFGRTPVAENRAQRTEISGRDHHPRAFSGWMAGGGVRGGLVVGKTDEFGWNPVEDPVHVNDFHATILHLFGLDHKRLTYRFQGRDFRLTDVGGQVVDRVLR